MNEPITVTATVNAPIERVWQAWNNSEDIPGWAFASDDWEASPKQNNLRKGGSFATTMSAKDKSASFDFGGIYTAVEEPKLLEYDLSDGRHVRIEFNEAREGVTIVQTFDPESENLPEMQRSGWQAILDNFKKYVEATD